MAWFSVFYQSGMSGQNSFRLPNGEDLPLPDPSNWNGESANIEVDFVNIPPPHRLRIHYRVVITTINGRSGRRTHHISELTNVMINLTRSQSISRTVGTGLAFFVGRNLSKRILGPVASITNSAPIGTDNYIRLIDGDRAFTYIIIR
jgi:hypothetical protein